MTPRTWEDNIQHAGCDDVIADRDRALAEQRAAIEALRELPGTHHQQIARQRVRERRIADARGWDADRVVALRDDLGITQHELAERIGVTRDAVGKWERGTSRPGRAVALLLDALEADGAPEVEPPRWTGVRVRALRMRISVLQHELAALVGVVDPTLWAWESGQTAISSRYWDRLDEIDRTYPTVQPVTPDDIRAIRERAGMSRAAFADAIMRTDASVRGYESGRYQPSLSVVRAIRRLEQIIDQQERQVAA